MAHTHTRINITLVILLILLSWHLSPTANAQGSVSPDQIDATLRGGECIEREVVVTLGEAPLPQLDVLLVIDVTGSMGDIISRVTDDAERITNDIRALVPDTAFGMVTMADYPTATDESTVDDYPWRLDQDLTVDRTHLQSALSGITLVSGGDEQESYIRALYEVQYVNWREDSRRIVLFFGDSYPHEPDPGRDTTLGTDDDLSLAEVGKQLAAANITVLAIYTNVAVEAFYTSVAEMTGGQSFRLDSVDQIPGAIQQLVESTVTRIQTLTLEPTPGGKAWLSWEPDVHHDVAPLETRAFRLAICVPDKTSGGHYDLELGVIGDGAQIDRVLISVQVPEPTPTPTFTPTPTMTPTPTPTPTRTATPTPTPVPVLLAFVDHNLDWCWIPLLAILLLTLLLWLMRRRGSARPVVGKPGPSQQPYLPDHRTPRQDQSQTGASVTHGKKPKPRPKE